MGREADHEPPFACGTSALVRSMAAVVPLVARSCRHLLWRIGPFRSGWWAALSTTSCSAFTATAPACWRPLLPTGPTSNCRSRRRSGRWWRRSAAGPDRCAERPSQRMPQPMASTTAQPLSSELSSGGGYSPQVATTSISEPFSTIRQRPAEEGNPLRLLLLSSWLPLASSSPSRSSWRIEASLLGSSPP
jgi:hypothetical protein